MFAEYGINAGNFIGWLAGHSDGFGGNAVLGVKILHRFAALIIIVVINQLLTDLHKFLRVRHVCLLTRWI